MAIDGLHRTGTGLYNGSSISDVRHHLSGPLDPNGKSILSADVYAFSAYHSHGAGVFLASSDCSASGSWIACWYCSGSPAWQFEVAGGGGGPGLGFISGSFDQPVHLEIAVDGGAGAIYGRLISSSGVFETPHFAVTSSYIAQMTGVVLQEDFRDVYLGADFDNISVTTQPLYEVCLLYDPTKAVHSGATIPIKLQLCDASGNDLSSSSIMVHAVSITQISNSISGAVDAAGNANPDFDFRFDATLGSTGGYIFNLKTTGLSTGTYNLNFTVTGDSFVYATPFQVK